MPRPTLADAIALLPAIMKISRLSVPFIAMLTLVPGINAESALMGWQAVQNGYSSRVENVSLTGPVARNRTPDKNGAFKGRFTPRNQANGQTSLIAIFQLSLADESTLIPKKIRFDLRPKPNEGNETKGAIEFETEQVPFESGDYFLLIFKTNNESEMMILPIVRLFVPS